MNNPTDYLNRKENKYVVPGNGRMEVYERSEAAQQRLEAERTVNQCEGLVFQLDERADKILWDHRCPPGNSRALRAALEALAPHERARLLKALRREERLQRWLATQARARAAAQTLGLRHPEDV